MAQLVEFDGRVYAASTAEAFHGTGSLDTVSYAKAPSAAQLGDYDLGVTVDLVSPSLNTGWALGDRFYFGTVERIIGSQYSDFLYGDAQSNILYGGGSPDFLYGRGGNDNLLGGGGFDFLYGGSGKDVLNGQWHTDRLYGNDGDDRIWGGTNYVRHFYPGTNYADVLFGGAGNDQLHGDARLPSDRTLRTEYYKPLDFMPGRDELHGGTGNDILNGDGGNDTLWGDGGADRFKFDAPYTVKDATGAKMRITSGNDVIRDFHPGEGDRLDLGGQAYSIKDTSNGIVITLGAATAPTGHVTLWQAHTFDKGWVV
jgi:Ca2+-binding RTX toxin-like protein